MVRSSKTASAKSASTEMSSSSPVVIETSTAPAVVDAVAPAPKKKSSKKSAASAAATEEPAPVVESVVSADAAATAEDATETAVVADDSVPLIQSSLKMHLNSVTLNVGKAVALITSIKNEIKLVEKALARELKASQKLSSKKKKRSGLRKPSGFIKPALISDELADFLGKERGTQMARTEVSKEINSYISAKDLKDKTNGRIILADSKLATLLKLSSEDHLNFFNLQRYLKHHYIKVDAPVVEAATATA